MHDHDALRPHSLLTVHDRIQLTAGDHVFTWLQMALPFGDTAARAQIFMGDSTSLYWREECLGASPAAPGAKTQCPCCVGPSW